MLSGSYGYARISGVAAFAEDDKYACRIINSTEITSYNI